MELADGARFAFLHKLWLDEFEVPTMTGRQDIDQIALRLVSLVPPGMVDAHKDMRANFRDILAQGLRHLELVTREEFDVQTQVLARTRARVEELEKRVAELEAALSPPGT
jgi:BMFP domain-containing protein YqiC